jgi:hypothetical protein
MSGGAGTKVNKHDKLNFIISQSDHLPQKVLRIDAGVTQKRLHE